MDLPVDSEQEKTGSESNDNENRETLNTVYNAKIRTEHAKRGYPEESTQASFYNQRKKEMDVVVITCQPRRKMTPRWRTLDGGECRGDHAL